MAGPDTQRRNDLTLWLPRLLLLILALHFARGILPLVPVEGDELGVSNGLEAWQRGSGDFEESSYLYALQPGSYNGLNVLRRFTGWPAMSVFGAASALAAAGFIALAAWLLSGMAALRPAWVAVALLLGQEFTTAAFYANTNALAGAWALAGLLAAHRSRGTRSLVLAGVLIGLGAWIRLDSLLLSPLVLALRLQVGAPGRACRETAVVAAVSLATLSLASAAVGLSPATILTQGSYRKGLARDWSMLGLYGWGVLGFVPSAAALVGLGWAAVTRRWLVLAAGPMVAIPTLANYGSNFSSPKYLYYAAPFLLLPALAGLRALLAGGPIRRGTAGLLLAAFAGESLLGPLTSAPEYRRFDPAPAGAVGAPITLGTKSLQVRFAEGEILPTADGPRLRGGQFWAPVVWHREKSAMQRELARFDRRMREDPPGLVVTSTYLAFRVADGWLRGHGYRPGPTRPFPDNPSSHVTEYRSDGRTVVLAQVNHTESDAAEFAGLARARTTAAVFVNDRGAIGARHLMAGTPSWRLLSERPNGLIALYEMPAP